MRTLKNLAAIIALALSPNAGEFTLEPGEKLDMGAMDFEATHLSAQRCDSINYDVERSMAWDVTHEFVADTGASAETTGTAVDTIVERLGRASPPWVVELRGRGAAYQDEKTRSTMRHEDRLSEFSPAELQIAKSMGLSPWNIDRISLRRWAKESPE